MDRATIIATIALLGVFVVFVRQNRTERSSTTLANGQVRVAPAVPASGPVEVAHHMARIQHHAEKLWWAGKAGNLELAKFYRHEIKEEMEVVANGAVVDDGLPVSEHMKVYGIRAIDAMKEQLATDGLKGFEDNYATLISTCNSCHSVTGHPELRMQVPTDNRFSGQDFTFKP